MRLIQVLVDGIPGANGALEYRFEPGLNPWKQKGSFKLDLIVEILISLFYPLSREKDPLGPGRSRRAGVVFEARGTTYRLVRDYSARKTIISQLEPGTKESFRDLSSETRFITEALSRSVKLPSQRVFRKLLVSVPGFLETHSAAPVESVEAAPSMARSKERLHELKGEFAQLNRVKAMESEIDEVQNRLFKIEDELRALVAPREELARVLSEYEPYGIFDRSGLVTPQVISKLKAYRSLEEKKATDLRSIEERSHQLEADLIAIPGRPLWKEPLLVAGGVIAVAAFVGTSVHRSYWLLVSILGLIVGFLGFFFWVRRSEKIAELKKGIRGLEPERAGIEKRFEIETVGVKKIRETLNLSDLEEIEEMIKRWEILKAERLKLEDEVRKVEERVAEPKLTVERDRLQKRLGSLQSDLANLPPILSDPQSMVQEIREQEAILGGDSQSFAADSESVSCDAITTLIEAMAEVCERETTEMIAQTKKAIDSNLAAVTDRRFVGLSYVRGEIPSFRSATGTVVSWPGLDTETQALLRFIVQFTFWQYLTALRPLPVFIDLLSANSSERLAQVAIAAARHLAKKAQTIILAP